MRPCSRSGRRGLERLIPFRVRAEGRLAAEDGMTLVEVLVAMMIMSIVVAAIFGVLFRVQAGVEREIDRATRTEKTRLATEAIDREVRSSGVMTAEAGGSGLVVYTLTNSETRGTADVDGASCAQFLVQGGQLKHRWWDPTDSTTAVPWQIVIDDVSSGTFEVDPNPDYGESILNVTLVIAGQGDAPDQNATQTLHGDNVVEGADNPCDGTDEPPTA